MMDWKYEATLHETEDFAFKKIADILDEDYHDSQDLDDIKDCLDIICKSASIRKRITEETKK